MKFTIFGFSEKYYKIITAFITIGVTIGCFIYYFGLQDKGDTFIIATVYAAFLFVVGLYLSYMSNSIITKMYQRRNEYIMLTRLDDIFSKACLKSLDSYSDIEKAIISFQVFSGRNREKNSKEDKKKAINNTIPMDLLMQQHPLIENVELSYQGVSIREIGFELNPHLLEVENSFLQKYSEIKVDLQNCINRYITENGIKMNSKAWFFEPNLLETNYEDWCNENVTEDGTGKKEMLIQYIFDVIASKESEFGCLEKKKKQVVKYYKKCDMKIQKNLKRMKDTYGNQMDFVVKTKEDILIEVERLSEKIDVIENLIESKASEAIEAVNNCDNKIYQLNSGLRTLQDNIVDEVRVDIEMLEEDLGIELYAKEKFKEMMKRK